MTRHPLPWSIQNGWLTLESQQRYINDDRHYALRVGRYDSTIASLNEVELRQLRDQIDAVFDAPYRVLVPNPNEHDDPRLPWEIRHRLDRIHGQHPRMQLAVLAADESDSVPAEWAMDARVEVLIFQTLNEMVADGGSLVLLVAGLGALDIVEPVHGGHLPVDLIRLADAEVTP